MNVLEMLAKVKEFPVGEYAECGVWQGFMAKHIAAGMNKNHKLYLFDTFKGHGEPCEHDLDKFHPQGRYADTSTYTVVGTLMGSAVVSVIFEGPVQETLPRLGARQDGTVEDIRFRFVHIDLDHYLPTKAACEFFKDRMVPGGIIRFDDYNHGETPGATKAINEVFGERNILTCDYRWEHNPTEGESSHA